MAKGGTIEFTVKVAVLRENADRVRLFDPATGEELDLPTVTTDQLAEMRAYIRDLEEDLRLAKQALDAEVIDRMDKAAHWTWNGKGYRLSAPSPAPVTKYDAPELYERLSVLAAKGVISWEALGEAVARVWDYKPRVAGINRLRKLGGEVAEAIDACATEVDRPRRVTLGRTS